MTTPTHNNIPGNGNQITRREAIFTIAAFSMLAAACEQTTRVSREDIKFDATAAPTSTQPIETTTTIDKYEEMAINLGAEINGLGIKVHELADPALSDRKAKHLTEDDTYVSHVTKFIANPDGTFTRLRARTVFYGSNEPKSGEAEVKTLFVARDVVDSADSNEDFGADSGVKFENLSGNVWKVIHTQEGREPIEYSTSLSHAVNNSLFVLGEDKLGLLLEEAKRNLEAFNA